MKRRLCGCALGALMAGIAPAHAERGYATDACTVPVQSGPAPGYKIVRMIGSGTVLEILEPNTKGYTKVRTPEGTAGWIMSEYLMEQPSARNRVSQLETRITTLENENRTLRGETETLHTFRDTANRCGEELATVKRTAAQTLEIDEENRRLQQEIEASHTRQQQLEAENSTLRDQSRRNWFLAGAGATFGGLLLGLIIPRLSFGRRRRWDQF
ncbi:MAG: TIGR04211 family SH3 domain-containing protein [Candidatus Competibacter denitrificans]